MKIDFLYAWTKNKDSQNEYMKSLCGGFRLPDCLRFLTRIIPQSKKE